MSQLISSHKFSYSQLSTYKVCPQQYKIIYLDGIRKYDESIEAFMGKRVHEVLDWLYSIDNLNRPYFTFDSLCQQYDERWIENWHDNIYIADNIGLIYVLDFNTGKLIWIKNHGVSLKSNIKIFKNKIYLINQNNRIICLKTKAPQN